MKKVLNLYSGIGGNRKLWKDCQVTAVEFNPDIAEMYSNFYPDDNLIIGDAHQYLLEHYKEFDFIWSSPPCPSHSSVRKMGVNTGQYPAVYPDIRLWEEITLLSHFCKSMWVVENVKLYYTPIVPPSFRLDRHCFWSNFYVKPKDFKDRGFVHTDINGGNKIVYGFDISKSKIKDKRKLLRNMVNPEIGEYILNTAMGWKTNESQLEMFT